MGLTKSNNKQCSRLWLGCRSKYGGWGGWKTVQFREMFVVNLGLWFWGICLTIMKEMMVVGTSYGRLGGCVSYGDATWLCVSFRRKAYQVPCCIDACESRCKEATLHWCRGEKRPYKIYAWESTILYVRWAQSAGLSCETTTQTMLEH